MPHPFAFQCTDTHSPALLTGHTSGAIPSDPDEYHCSRVIVLAWGLLPRSFADSRRTLCWRFCHDHVWTRTSAPLLDRLPARCLGNSALPLRTPFPRLRLVPMRTPSCAMPAHWPLERPQGRLLGTAAALTRATSTSRQPGPLQRGRGEVWRVPVLQQHRRRPRLQQRGRRRGR